MAGIPSSGAHAAPLAPLPEPPAAEGHGGSAADNNDDNDNSSFFPLLDLLERFPDLFAQKVLAHLAPIDRTFLGQAGSACRAAVAASDLPRAGTEVEVLEGSSVWVVTHRLTEFVGSIERLAWAKASGCPWIARICSIAAWGGHLEVLKWAREQGCPWDERTCASAAKGGFLEVLRWAREHHCPWNDMTSVYAAEKGHLDVLQWAVEHGCPWNHNTCYWPAVRGNLKVLRWLREHGCPWYKRECEVASRKHPETLAWVRAQPDVYE